MPTPNPNAVKEKELLPCPLCGGEANKGGFESGRATCTNTKCPLGRIFIPLDWWNTRVQSIELDAIRRQCSLLKEKNQDAEQAVVSLTRELTALRQQNKELVEALKIAKSKLYHAVYHCDRSSGLTYDEANEHGIEACEFIDTAISKLKP